MTNSFGLLNLLSRVFKILAWVVLLLMMVGLVGTLVASKDPASPVPVPMILNMAFSGVLAFLMLFAFGEVIRLLLTIEQQTRKE